MAKLILTHEVTGLGAAGDVVEVKDGYARNYLLPRNFALTWSKGGEKQVSPSRLPALPASTLPWKTLRSRLLHSPPSRSSWSSRLAQPDACSAPSSRPTWPTLLRPQASAHRQAQG